MSKEIISSNLKYTFSSYIIWLLFSSSVVLFFAPAAAGPIHFFYGALLIIGFISIGPFTMPFLIIASECQDMTAPVAMLLLMNIVVFIALWKWSRSKLWSKKRHLTLIKVWLPWGTIITFFAMASAM